MAVVTTRAVKNEEIKRGGKPLEHVTTKDVKVEYIDKPIGKRDDGVPIFEAPKSERLTTRNLEDIAEKNKRAEVMAEIEAFENKQASLGGKVEVEVTAKKSFARGETIYDISEEEGFNHILLGTLSNGEIVGLFDPNWQKEPVWTRKKK